MLYACIIIFNCAVASIPPVNHHSLVDPGFLRYQRVLSYIANVRCLLLSVCLPCAVPLVPEHHIPHQYLLMDDFAYHDLFSFFFH